MSESPAFDIFGDDRAVVEVMVRASRHYVQPSDDLRPRILEAAREHCSDRRAEQKLGSFAIAVLLLALLSSPAIQYTAMLRPKTAAWSYAEVQHRAAELAARREVGSEWALAEAFSQCRNLQAARLNGSRLNSR